MLAYALHMPAIVRMLPELGVNHVRKLARVRTPCQVRDFGGVGAEKLLTHFNFLTHRNFFLTQPS